MKTLVSLTTATRSCLRASTCLDSRSLLSATKVMNLSVKLQLNASLGTLRFGAAHSHSAGVRFCRFISLWDVFCMCRLGSPTRCPASFSLDYACAQCPSIERHNIPTWMHASQISPSVIWEIKCQLSTFKKTKTINLNHTGTGCKCPYVPSPYTLLPNVTSVSNQVLTNLKTWKHWGQPQCSGLCFLQHKKKSWQKIV